MAAARAAVVADPAVLLSDRELDVLALLPSLLTAAGDRRGVRGVGEHGQVTRARIYAKLGVSSRSEAVAHAHDARAAALSPFISVR